MDILTITCTRDRYAMQLLAHTLDRFVTDPCVHHVVIEDNDTSYGEWLTLLLPHYTKHQLKIVHDYNLSSGDMYRGGYFRQQQIKLQMSEKIYADKYIVIDSKTIFFKPVTMSQWPVHHGNRTIGTIPQYDGWVRKMCEMMQIPYPDPMPLAMTPFVIKTATARNLVNTFDVTALIWRDPIHDTTTDNLNPSEFLLYTLYAMQEDSSIIPTESKPAYVFCYSEEDMIRTTPEWIENSNILTFGIDRSILKTEYLKYLSVYYTWLLSKGIEQEILDAAWFGPLFDSVK